MWAKIYISRPAVASGEAGYPWYCRYFAYSCSQNRSMVGRVMTKQLLPQYALLILRTVLKLTFFPGKV